MSEKTDTRRPFVGVMAKAPRPGHAKTRLTSALAPDVAADLYRHFLLDTVDVVRRVPGVAAALLCPAGDGAELARLDTGLPIVEQRAPGLMQGLAFGVAYALDGGHRAVALINADSPTLPPARIADAFAALATARPTPTARRSCTKRRPAPRGWACAWARSPPGSTSICPRSCVASPTRSSTRRPTWRRTRGMLSSPMRARYTRCGKTHSDRSRRAAR